MSGRALPLLFLNLGGEMLYILDQRLRAQSIPGEKARKDEWTDVDRKRVMNDIITTMFNKKFMEELFKPQELYSKKALRTVYDRLAHASIMRLNQASMDKLYDLMTMAFKYQVLLCPRPKDILLVTFNHLDAIKDFIRDSPGILNQVDETFRQLIEVYGCLSAGEFQLIRQTLLLFFQDMHIRVSIFLKDKVQNSNGRFVLPISGPVPWGTEVPGLIRMYNRNGDEVKRTEFTTDGNYITPQREGSFDLYGDRVLKLGTNMYSVSRPVETHMSGSSKNLASHVKENVAPNPLAKEELNFLARLLGGLDIKKPGGSETGFRLNLFTTDEEEEQAALTRPEELSYKVVNIQATQDRGLRAELARIVGELEVAEPSPASSGKGEDLLALMDGLRAMEVSHSVKERTIAENSLVILLQGLHGHVTTVDLRDESTATGRVTNVDAFMNMRLAEVTFTDRRGAESRLDELFVTGRNVRYVHIPDQVDIRATIERQLELIHRVRYFGGRDKGRREFPRAKHK